MGTHVTDREVIDRFLGGARIALAGVSSRSDDFSRYVFRELVKRGYDMVPVHPGLKEIEGRPAYGSVTEVPGRLDGVLIMTPPEVAERIVMDCAEAGIGRVWLHRGMGRGAVSPEAVAFCQAHGIEVVAGQCPMMFLEGTELFHRAHRGWRRLLGRYPEAAPRLDG
jgi:uncharacterized protein